MDNIYEFLFISIRCAFVVKACIGMTKHRKEDCACSDIHIAKHGTAAM